MAGQAERLACHWQPNAFCGLTPTPTLDGPRAEGQREEKITPVWPCEPLCGADGAGRHPRAHKNPLTALVEAVWRKAGTAARTRFHPKTESEPTGWKYSRRKPWRFYSAWAVTSARSAGGFRGRRLTLFRRERDLVDADFWKRTGKASSWGIFCDAHLGCQPFSGG